MSKKALRRITIVVYGVVAYAILVWWLLFFRGGVFAGLMKAIAEHLPSSLTTLLVVAVAVWAMTRRGLSPRQQDPADQSDGYDPQVALAYKERWRLQAVALSPLAVLLALVLLGLGAFGEGGALWVIFLAPPALVLTIGAALVTIANWRCPACNKPLKGMNPTCCSKCGARFRD